jgi:DNA-binding NarL/FixJ family response regulator
MIRVVITDDNSFLQTAIKDKLSFFDDISIEYTAINGKDLLEKLQVDKTIDIILMDIEMPTMNGIEATNLVKKLYPQIKILILTVFDNDEHVFNAIKAGADGYLLKDVNPDDLHKGILDTLEGGASMTPSIAMKALRLLREPLVQATEEIQQTEFELSRREVEVLEQLSKGLKYEAIAENLFLSAGTVRKHVQNIYTKLQVHNKLEAIKIAKDNRLF